MANSTVRSIIGDMSSKSKGKDYTSALVSALAPKKIVSHSPTKQPGKKK